MDPLSYFANESQNTEIQGGINLGTTGTTATAVNGNGFQVQNKNKSSSLNESNKKDSSYIGIDLVSSATNHHIASDHDEVSGEGEEREADGEDMHAFKAGEEVSIISEPPPTSLVFNLSSYNISDTIDTTNEHSAKNGSDPSNNDNTFCCELARVFDALGQQSANLFIPDYDVQIHSLRDQPKPQIIIQDASKLQDMAGKTFVSYLIHAVIPTEGGGMVRLESRHRYSDFESLREILVQTYDFVVVPPIPEKHSVVAYASKPGTAQQDPNIIAKRKRLLQSFLNRIAMHVILRKSHYFHLFLKGDGVWSDVVTNASLRRRPSTILEANQKLRKPDVHFSSAMDYTVRFGNQILYIRKIHKKMIAQYRELISIYMELGACYNGWSLSEDQLSESIEQMGQAVDSTVTATGLLQSQLDERYGDFLGEYKQFSSVLQSILVARHKAHVEFEGISEKLVVKQTLLARLESSEHESQRLAAVLSTEGGPQVPMNRPSGFMAQINALLDTDPDTTRRITISKTKDAISQLEVDRETSRTSLLALNSKIQRDLDRFQKQKVKDLRNALVVVVAAHREFHEKVVDAWQIAKGAVEKIG